MAYTYDNGNEYRGQVQIINGLPYDAAGQPLIDSAVTANPNIGLEAGNENSLMLEKVEAEEGPREDGLDLAPNERGEGDGFFSTLRTAGSNLSTDALQELVYIAEAVTSPIDTGEAILRVVAGYAQKALPNSFEQYLPEDWATNKMYANAINDYYAEKYGSLEQAADSFAEQPVSVALDVFAVKALLTAVTKQAVKRSNATTKMAVTAKGTPLEGELAARASAELKVATELERTVKYEGKLVYDDAVGAYVPEASVTKADKIDVAPIVAQIDETKPTLNNGPNGLNDTSKSGAILGVSDEGNALLAADFNKGMMTREVIPNEKILANEVLQEVKLIDEVKAAVNPVNKVTEVINPGKEFIDNLPGATRTSGLDLSGVRTGDGSLVAASRNREVIPNEKVYANEVLQESRLADEFKIGASMADDAKMAGATQAELFSKGTAAQYELAQASRIANDLAKVSPDVPAVVGTRMLATSPETRMAKLTDVEMKTTPRPVSVPQTKLNVDVKKVVPAIQRVAAASSQQAERGADNSFLPPDMTLRDQQEGSGELRIEDKPDSGLIADMPPYEKSIDDRDIGGESGVVSTRPGWKLPQEFEGSTTTGNYLSADFDDEHWNTAAGVNEAIGIWGRPIGTRSSGPTTAKFGGQSPSQSMKHMRKYGAGSASNWK